MQDLKGHVGTTGRMPQGIRPPEARNDAAAGMGQAEVTDDQRPDTVDWATIDWEDLVPRLLLLAVARLSRMTWRGQRGVLTPGGAEATDFVNDAIAKTMDGVRVWRQDACSLFQHLAGIIVSDISHAATAAENRLTLSDDGRDRPDGRWPPDCADETPNQEQTTLWRSEQHRLLDHLRGIDPVMGKMAELILIEDIDETKALTLKLDLEAHEVANLRKRLKRAITRYLLADQTIDTEVGT